MSEYWSDLKEKILSSRVGIMMGVMVLFAVILLSRLFILQIIRGEDYQSNYNLKVNKTETIDATRGNIYDRNGNLLAYNELAYAVTIEDNGSYESTREKNRILNQMLYEIITHLEANGDPIRNDFGIYYNSASGSYSFAHSGTSLQRFRADVFGYSDISDLKKNASESSYGINEADATPEEIMDYLYGDKRYQISEDYPKKYRYEIAVIRYNISQNSYQKYISTTIATDISDKSMAYVKENQADFIGVEVEEQSVRRYVDSECFANIIGYTGKISTQEYEELSQKSDRYSINDIIGKSGIESYMNDYLSGTKGYETVYVDSVGNVLLETDKKDAVPGGDVYLSIDKDLTIATYDLLEKEIASIIYSKIVNTKEYTGSSSSSASDIVIPIYDVYFALINNNLISINALSSENASDLEKKVYSTYVSKSQSVEKELKEIVTTNTPVAYSELPKEYQQYCTYIVKTLRADNVLLSDSIDTTDEVYIAWTNEELSAKEYLTHCIENDWVDISLFTQKSLYVDTNEVYENLVDYIISDIFPTTEFEKLIFQYAILNDEITGNELCAILYDQGYLEADDEVRSALANEQMSAYNFMKEKIRTLEITPGELALDPCSGSCVLIDTNTGEVLACVSYPGYDSNKLANSVDTSYYSQLVYSLSNPMYNHATQQRTAPGSTFKMVSAMAALSENIITPATEIEDLGEFELVSNKPKCWFYPNTHGSINVSEALRDSCNYFFYQVGYDMAGGERYNDERGINIIQKYASLVGLDEKTGVEVEENKPSIATEYPVMAAIGQSDHNFTTISLARYATAIANSGTVYNLSLLDHVTDAEGKVLKEYGPTVRNQVDVLNSGDWFAIHSGMRMVVEELDSFDEFEIPVAGKTGTAQQVKTRPNHALFVGYAPYDRPDIAIATRIAFGYTSHNAADLSRQILSVYFKTENVDDILNGTVDTSNSSTNRVTD